MTVNVLNVMVGTATLWVAPWSGGEPVAAPADSVAQGAAWGGTWTSPGATDQGVTLNYQPKTNDIMIEEQLTPAKVTVDTVDLGLEVSLAEDVIANIQLALGGAGTITTQAATSSLIGKSTLVLSDALEQLSVGFEGVNPSGYWRRLYIPSVLSVGSVKASYRRAKSARLYALNLRCVCDLSQVQIVDMTAPET